MNVLIAGKYANELHAKVTTAGLSIVFDKPDIVISYGGDGTLLSAEYEYPTIPKLAIRNSKICTKCHDHEDIILLQALANGTLKEVQFQKIEAQVKNVTLVAANDIVISHTVPIHAIRFLVSRLNNKEELDEPLPITNDSPLIIGDGIIAATAFGATGYFHSITRSQFTKGFALAFNNTIEEHDPIYFNQGTLFRITVVRGPGLVSFDNNTNMTEINEHDTIVIGASKQTMRLLAPGSLHCPECKVHQHKRLGSL